MTKKFPILVVIADAGRARILTVEGPEQPLTEKADLVHPESRLRESELLTDRPGRVSQSHAGPHPGHGSRSGMEPGTHATDVEHERFAREVADHLKRTANGHAAGRIVLVVSPVFLGLLRKELDPQLTDRISVTVHKDYTHLGLNELERRLKEYLI
jgi:protein required for attachment to host cells